MKSNPHCSGVCVSLWPCHEREHKAVSRHWIYYTLDYTARSSFYELPEGGTLHFSDVRNIPQLPAKSTLPADQRILRDWRDNYGQPVIQVTVRNQSTKDNVGTLPLYAYTTPQPKPQPLSFTKATHTPDNTANSNRPHNEILFPVRTVLALKPTLLCNRSFGDDQGSPSAT